jgi:hypothetical protein
LAQSASNSRDRRAREVHLGYPATSDDRSTPPLRTERPHDVSRQPPALHDQQQPGLAVLLIDELGSAGVAAFPQGHVASRVAGTSKPVISFRVRVVRRQRGAGRRRLVAGPTKETRCPCSSERNPSPTMPLRWTKGTPPPFAVMRPCAFSSSNQRTVPVRRRPAGRGPPDLERGGRDPQLGAGEREAGGHPGGRRARERRDRDAPVARAARRAPRLAPSARWPGRGQAAGCGDRTAVAA